MRTTIKSKPVDFVRLSDLIRDHSIELDDARAMDLLLEKIGDARYVLLGEASHGTHEYYTWRTQITRKLIEEKKFSFVAVEGDWPDCYRVNRYVKNYADGGASAREVFQQFNRWPTWMWANWETIALAEWMRKHNEGLASNHKAGFYGLDVYSLWESLDSIIDYLDKKDPQTKKVAVKALQCFEPYGEEEGQAYARATLMVPELCENEVIDLLLQVRKNMIRYNTDPESVMSAEQNAHVIVNAEQYYRAMVRPGPASWNLRDHHMVNTLERLMQFYGPESKAIVWEHNTHIGDARATDMARENMVNVGQLLNEQHEEEGVYAVGFGSYKGTVIAGSEWGAPMQEMEVPDARNGSWEDLLHRMDAKDRIIFMSDAMKQEIGKTEIPHRAIGVVYRPAYEMFGNYVPTRIPYRYNAFIYIGETSALHPLHIRPDGDQVPETYPFGI